MVIDYLPSFPASAWVPTLRVILAAEIFAVIATSEVGQDFIADTAGQPRHVVDAAMRDDQLHRRAGLYAMYSDAVDIDRDRIINTLPTIGVGWPSMKAMPRLLMLRSQPSA